MSTAERHLWSRVRGHGGIVLLLLIYLTLAVAYSLASPLYEPTDELRHFRYVRHIVAYHELPVQRADAPRAQSHHPPLYYGLSALASSWVSVEHDVYREPPSNPFWGYRDWETGFDNKNQYLHGDDERFPFRGEALAVYVVRALTIFIGAGVVWLTYCIGLEVFRHHPALALGCTALVAFNPQFVYLSGAINNDIPAALWGAAVLLTCIRITRRGSDRRTDIVLGILYGLALLTKIHLLALLGIIELTLMLAVWRSRDWRAFLRSNLTILCVAFVISGWWFARNQVLYGDPTGMNKVNELWAGRPASENWWAIRQSIPYLWSSLWGRFGYGQIPLPQNIYRALSVFCAFAAMGHLIRRRAAERQGDLGLLAADILIFVLVVLYYILIQPAGAMGRFLFPSLAAFAVVVFGGLIRLFPQRLSIPLSWAVAVAMLALATYARVGVLAPAFARPPLLTQSEMATVPNPVGLAFGDTARLLGYQVMSTAVTPGDTLEVTLYWQALARTNVAYANFVHVLSDIGTVAAQRDSYPGLGKYPTTVWTPGDAFADTYRVHIPETAYAPDKAFVQVGFYLPEGPRLVTAEGQETLRLAEIEIRPGPGEFPNALDTEFGEQIGLVGYALDRRVTHPGGTIRLTLYWRALAQPKVNYNIFAHVLGAENQIWANSDSWPVNGSNPTRQWEVGQVIEDVRELTVGLTTPPGLYDIEVGIHQPGVGRLPVVAEDGHWLGKRVLLSMVRVASN